MRKVIVIGMGAIGKSISLALAQNNCDVTVVTKRGKEGFKDLYQFIEKAVINNGVQESKNKILSRISWVADFSEIPHDAILVIEATKENLNEKQRLFARVDKISPSNMILSSTTSSLNITDISHFMVRPERMIGLHFFNPATIMKLVEVVPGEKTSKKTIQKAKTFLEGIGKTPIVLPDQPGFLVNRVLFAMINEAINVLGEGKITVEHIDLAMKLGTNQPMGPLHLADFVGLDVCLSIFENLYEKTKRLQYKPHPVLIQKVKANNLGRKTGKGFFNYTPVPKNEKK